MLGVVAVSATSQPARARLPARRCRLGAVDPRCARRQRRSRPTRVVAPRALDAGTAPALAAHVQAAAARHRRVTVDLRHVVAIDSAGLRVLRRLTDRLPVDLRGASPITRSRLALTGLGASRRAPRA
jgi:anti-anti-sigma regulatory factor